MLLRAAHCSISGMLVHPALVAVDREGLEEIAGAEALGAMADAVWGALDATADALGWGCGSCFWAGVQLITPRTSNAAAPFFIFWKIRLCFASGSGGFCIVLMRIY